MNYKKGKENTVKNLTNIPEKELIDCLAKNLHYNPKWGYCLLQFPKKKTYVVNITSPSLDQECTHVLIVRDAVFNYKIAFIDLENNTASCYRVSPSFLKMLYDNCFFNNINYFSISVVENDLEFSFEGNFILKK